MLRRYNGQWGFSEGNAVSFGVNEAIFIQFLLDELYAAYLLRLNGRGNRKFELVIEDGQPWMPWTNKDFCDEFPFWSGHQIRRIISSCKEQGVIKTANYNSNPWDQRLWYTVMGANVNEWTTN